MSDYLSLIDRVETADAESKLGRLRVLRLHDIEVWPLIRVRLNNLPPATTHLMRNVSVGQVLLLIKGGLQLSWAMLRLIISGPSQSQGCVFFSHPENMAQMDGQWHDRSCDPISAEAQRLGQATTVLEYSASLKWIRPSARPRLDITLVLALAKVFSMLLVRMYRYRAKDQLSELEHYLDESGANKCVNVNEVHSLAAFVACARVLLAVAMRPWRFRLGFVCTYYSSSAMAFVMACRKLDIPVYDIQHGVQGEGHVAYRSWRTKDGRMPEALPDGFWCWDDASSAHLKSWCSPTAGPRVVIGGDVWTEYVLSNATDELCRADDASVRRTVMVSLQPVLSPLPDILLQAMAATSADVLWLVRLHPVMTGEFAVKLMEQLHEISCHNFLIQGNTDDPLPRQLLRTDLHVTLYSSVVIEAAVLGVFSVLLDSRAVGIFPAAVNSGQAALVHSAQEILAFVADAKRTDHSKMPVKRIASALQEILENISSPR